ncbi:MAG: PAS domain S-box protein [Planctomycetota bacterium]
MSSYFAGRSHDPSRAAIEIGGERYILVRAASLSIEFFALVRRLLGEGREADADEFARNILFDLAHAIGKADAENFHAKMGLVDPIARLSAGPIHFSHSGWAFVKISPESRPSPDENYYLTYEHPQSFEADAWLRSGQKSDSPVCVMNAGYSSGWCEASFGVPLVAAEILCRARGDSCCRFVMAPPETICQHVERHAEREPNRVPAKATSGIPEFFARKRLEDELRKSQEGLLRHNALLHAVNQLFEKALGCEDEREVAGVCLAMAEEELTGSAFGFIVEMNPRGRFDTIAVSDPSWRACEMPSSSSTVRIEDMEVRGIWGRVLKDERPLIVNDPLSHPDHVGVPEGHPPIDCFLGVPLKHGGRTIGMIALANKEGGYEPADERALEVLSGAFVEALMMKRAEALLRESEAKHRLLTENLKDVVFTLSPDGNLTYCSPAAREFGGYDPEEVLGSSINEYIVTEEDRAKAASLLGRILSTRESATLELLFRPSTGDPFPVEVSAKPLVESGQVVAFQCVMRDISERKSAEEALRKKDEELRQSQKLEAIGGLAGGIAHEFNNLLQAIGGYTKYAMEGLSPEEQRHQDLEQVLKAADRATTLTRQLLGFSRRQVLRRKNIQPNEVVADLTKMVRPVIGEHIQLDLSLGEDVGTVYADLGELQQVLLNLCLNARDAMPSGGELLLKTENTVLSEAFCEAYPDTHPGRHVTLSVSDTGCGMSPEVRQHIFEPFFTTKKVGQGSGLGLATVYGVVQQHGGAIHAYSEVGKGSTFKIFLPAVDAAPDRDEAERALPPPGGTETILLAEDEPMVRNLGVRVLESAGYKVMVASDGQEALDVYEQNEDVISLLLLDTVMPKLDGHEVYRRAKERNPTIRVVFCTGYDPETSRFDRIKDNNLNLVEKPFDPDALLRTVREVLDAEEPCQLEPTTC